MKINKKISVIGIVLCFLGQVDCFAQSIKSRLDFTVNGPKESGVNLYRLKDGKAISLGFQRPDKDGKGGFDIDEKKEGIYFIAKAGGKGTDYKNVLYIKKGDQQRIDLFLDRYSVDYDSCIVRKPNSETKILQSWTNRFNQYCKDIYGKQSESYAAYEGFQTFAKQFLEKNQTTNAYFNTWLTDKIQTDLIYLRAANFFHFVKRLNGSLDTDASVAHFYQPLLAQDLVSNPAVLRSEHGLDLLNYLFAFWRFRQDNNAAALATIPFSEHVPLIQNDQVKAAYIISKFSQIRRYEDFKQQVEPFKAVLSREEDQLAYQKKYEELYLFAKGTRGYNFNLKDVHDKIYTLDSFKGKVLVLDMWAMWCAPCLAEKPVMEKIAEGYKDRNDIAFVGVSVDGLNRRDVWKNFVEKRGFTTIELLSNATESIQKYYRIEGIPRFLIFDRTGKIVTVDAPRPSEAGFKKILDQALAEH